MLLTAVLTALVADLPTAAELRLAVESAGWAAPVVFVALYAVVTLAPVPKNLLSAVAGLVFGLVPGILLVLLAALLGALLGFGLGRLLGRAAVERITSRRVQEVDALLASRGLLAVVTVRLVPVIPFTAINYASGLTAVTLRDYTLGTALGMIPGTIAYVTLGSYGTTPGAWPFLVAAGALAALSVGGLLLARRRRTPATPEGD